MRAALAATCATALVLAATTAAAKPTPTKTARAAATATLASAPASAEASAAAAAPATRTSSSPVRVPLFEELPVGRVGLQPTTRAPKAIGGHERVAGLFTSRQKHTMKRGTTNILTIHPTAAAATAATRGRPLQDDRSNVCFYEAHAGRDVSEAVDWSGGAEQATLWAATDDNQGSGVTGVRRETLEVDGDRATLRAVHAWVDPNTGGAREFARTEQPLVVVGRAFGATVFAGRESRGAQSFVHFVVRSPEGSERLSSLMDGRAEGMMNNTSCNHLRSTFAAKSGAGDNAVVSLSVVTERKSSREGVEVEETRTAAQTMRNSVPGRMEPGDRSPRHAFTQHDLRLRPIAVYLGVSQTTVEPQPVLTASFAWAGRETRRTMTSFD